MIRAESYRRAITRALSRCVVAAVLAIGIALTPAPGAHAAPGDLTFVGCVQAATT